MATFATPLAAFRQAYFGPIDEYLAWHDGYEADPTYLTALSPAEQAQAETELLTALRHRQADARAVLGLGHLRSEEALPLLHHYLRQGWNVYYILTAIAAINPAGLDRTILLHVLLGRSVGTSHLMDALLGLHDGFTLPQVGTHIAWAVLHRFTHPDYLIRYHALNALRRYGVSASPDIHQDTLFGLICKKRAPRAYRQAQQLFSSQAPVTTLQQFPLTDSVASHGAQRLLGNWRRWLGGL